MCRQPNLLRELAWRRFFRRLTAPYTAPGKFHSIRQDERTTRIFPTHVDRHKRPLMGLMPRSPPGAGQRETKAVSCPPGSVENCGLSGLPKVTRMTSLTVGSVKKAPDLAELGFDFDQMRGELAQAQEDECCEWNRKNYASSITALRGRNGRAPSCRSTASNHVRPPGN